MIKLILLRTRKLENQKHVATSLERVKKSKGGSNKVNARGSALKKINLTEEGLKYSHVCRSR